MTPDRSQLPGADLVDAGIKALARNELTVEALLVAIGASRLRAAGVELPDTAIVPSHPEVALYELIGASHPNDTHSRYNSLIRRLISFERALERRRSRRLSA